MRTPRCPTFAVRIVAISLLLVGAVAGCAPAAPTAAAPGGRAGPVLFTGSGRLSGVAAVSAADAWAVGAASGGRTLIVHWNGTAWTQVRSPSPAGGSQLSGVAVASADSAWAVGYTYPSSRSSVVKTLILHWNGTAWTQVPGTDGAGDRDSGLSGVAAISAGGAWAVGDYSPGGSGCGCVALILRWNGTAWTQVPGPSPAGGVDLTGVAAVSAQDAWVVGYTAVVGARTSGTVILRWNGAEWQRVPSPNPKGNAVLGGVAATSAGNVWAVGSSGTSTSSRTLILRWTGTTWT